MTLIIPSSWIACLISGQVIISNSTTGFRTAWADRTVAARASRSMSIFIVIDDINVAAALNLRNAIRDCPGPFLRANHSRPDHRLEQDWRRRHAPLSVVGTDRFHGLP